jgi:4-amino-4-deoxy-L-arabinose transferase-like glycosyltransferase
VESRPVPLLLAAAIPVFFLGLGANSIWDANEAFYVETPRQMLATGDYISPSFNGEPRFNKPVLSYWIVAAFYHVFGESVAAERLAIAAGAMGLLWAVYTIGRALRLPDTGLLAALILATAPRVVFFSRRIFIDVYITMFMAMALACFVMAARSPERRRAWLIGMYVALGLGTLTKGPMALALPALTLLVWLVSERRIGDVRRLMLLPGAAIVLAIVAPWYLAIYAQHGWAYIWEFFVVENLGRYANPVTTDRPFFFFLPVLFVDMLLPWAPLLLVPIVTAWRKDDDPNGAIRRLLWWWIVVVVGFFSLSSSKEDLYIFPAVPAAAALIADALLVSRWTELHRGLRAVLAGIAVLCVLLAAAIALYFRDGFYGVAGATPMAILLALGSLLILASLWQRRFEIAGLTLAATFIMFNYLFVTRALPDIERLKPVPPLAAVIADSAGPDGRLGFFNMDLPSLVYYARRPVTKLGDLEAAVRFFNDHREVWVLAGEEQWTELSARVPSACIAARHPLFVAKGSDILDRRPPPDVLLVKKCN